MPRFEIAVPIRVRKDSRAALPPLKPRGQPARKRVVEGDELGKRASGGRQIAELSVVPAQAQQDFGVPR
jgi:hypothetical protein